MRAFLFAVSIALGFGLAAPSYATKGDAFAMLESLKREAADPTTAPAALGDIQWQIGMRYLRGDGTRANARTAYRWIAKGAANGSSNAMISRAVMLATGDGVREDDVAARASYTEAIALRDGNLGHALRGLGGMLYFGEGGPVDRLEGCAYLTTAFQFGDEMAQVMLEEILPQTSSADEEACVARAAEWLEAAMAPRTEDGV